MKKYIEIDNNKKLNKTDLKNKVTSEVDKRKKRNSGSDWSRLDNAAKIFPSTSEKNDTRVFRFYCALNEDVNPEILQQALDDTMQLFPFFQVALRKGLFWYYLEESPLEVKVEVEHEPPCSKIYDGHKPSLLFRVVYFRKRISFEVYHALTDGTGATQFLRTLIYKYLILAHGDEIKNPTPIEVDAAVNSKGADSFVRYYEKQEKQKKAKAKKVRAYQIKGEHIDDGTIQVTEGIVSTKKALEIAKSKYHTTLTVFLIAVMIKSVGMEMYLSDKNRPVIVMVPVNLRNYFPSQTAKNFFAMISVTYDFSKGSGEIEEIIDAIDQSFKESLTKEKLAKTMNGYAELEHNPFIRAVPLPLKNLVLRAARHITDVGATIAVSNVGRIIMPEEFAPYIDNFGFCCSTLTMQLCLCSYNDRLQLGFGSAYLNTEIQRNFFRLLNSFGLDVEINSNDFNE